MCERGGKTISVVKSFNDSLEVSRKRKRRALFVYNGADIRGRSIPCKGKTRESERGGKNRCSLEFVINFSRPRRKETERRILGKPALSPSLSRIAVQSTF